jgi:hypothetical protein
MKPRAAILWLFSAFALLCGCGGDAHLGGGSGFPPLSPPPASHTATENWLLSLISTIPGTPPAKIAGSITQSGTSVSGAMHVEDSACFDRLTTISLSGTLTGGNISLTSRSVNGQVISFTGIIIADDFSATYSISGGCADGDQGNATGSKVGGIGGTWRIIFDVNEQHVGFGRAMLTQGSAGSEGSFGISGTVTNNIEDTSCYAGTIVSETFPNASYIIGRSVNLEIKLVDGGTVNFLGTLNEDGEFSGVHHVVGGICDGYFGGACFGRNLQASCHVPF